jgi:hypothetical protein
MLGFLKVADYLYRGKLNLVGKTKKFSKWLTQRSYYEFTYL